jgi:hypothetical protein
MSLVFVVEGVVGNLFSLALFPPEFGGWLDGWDFLVFVTA